MLVQGGQVPEFHIVPNLARLQAAGVTLLELVNAVQESNIIDSPGLYEANHQLILGLIGAQAHSAAELSNLIVKTSAGGVAIRVGDVADGGAVDHAGLYRGQVKRQTRCAAQHHPSALGQHGCGGQWGGGGDGSTAIQVAARGSLESFYDQSELVRESILSVRDAILIGLVLACIILFLFLHDWTSSLVAGLVIPVTVAVTILFLRITGQSFNLMTLGGLAAAIGLVIDDAIVVVENIAVHREAGESRIGSVRKAIHEISRPLVFSTITPVIVFLPLVSVTQVTGSFFRALAVTMTVALLTSLLLALTFTPALSLRLEKKAHPETASAKRRKREKRKGFLAGMRQRGGNAFRRLLHYHERALEWSFERPLALVAVCAVLIIAGYFSYRGLGSDLLPAMDEGAFVLDYFTPAGTSLTETNRILEHVDQILHAHTRSVHHLAPHRAADGSGCRNGSKHW